MSSVMDGRVTRRAALRTGGLGLLAALLGPAAASAADPRVVVEDWQDARIGTPGVPSGWRPYETPGGHPAYDFTIVMDEGRPALDLKSAGDHSTIAKELRVDLAAAPILTWDWKVIRLPRGADLRQRRTSDATGHIFVVWPRFPALLRSRLIGYVWDATLPAGTFVKSAKTGTVTFVVTRSGMQELGRWVTEERNVGEDYHTVFGEPAPAPGAVALSIDTNDTRSAAEALFGRIAFDGPRG
jgi:Protein of unknown function (DUF3047)